MNNIVTDAARQSSPRVPADSPAQALVDSFARKITYLRMSVTDRCDFRCVYCMPQKMQFMPKKQLATLEELLQLAQCFSGLGVRKLRITGGEPLVRRNILWLLERLGTLKSSGGIDQLLMTSNGSQLAATAKDLRACGIDRINVSLDSLDAHQFSLITRGGDLHQVIAGIDAALAEGIGVKINVVALKGVNDDAPDDFIRFAAERQCDVTFIEVMPMGDIGNENRLAQYLPLDDVLTRLKQNWDLTPSTYRSGGPARYQLCRDTGQKIGFITPLTHNFCELCNRVRLSASGKLYSCLGQDNQFDLLKVMRANPNDPDALATEIHRAIADKPKGHDFVIDRDNVNQTGRYMSTTGG